MGLVVVYLQTSGGLPPLDAWTECLKTAGCVQVFTVLIADGTKGGLHPLYT